jgi:hypothetical protein
VALRVMRGRAPSGLAGTSTRVGTGDAQADDGLLVAGAALGGANGRPQECKRFGEFLRERRHSAGVACRSWTLVGQIILTVVFSALKVIVGYTRPQKDTHS